MLQVVHLEKSLSHRSCRPCYQLREGRSKAATASVIMGIDVATSLNNILMLNRQLFYFAMMLKTILHSMELNNKLMNYQEHLYFHV